MSARVRKDRPAQEHKDIHVRAIVIVMSLIVLTIGIAVWIASMVPRPAKPSVTKQARDLRSVTHYVTADPTRDIETYRRQKEQEITTYGWVDANRTAAHVPIDRAMQMLANHSATQEQRK